MKDWRVIARLEGRICPECKQPVSKEQWKHMNRAFFRRKKQVDICYTCHLAHWDYPVIDCRGTGGNVFADNAEREVFNDVREG